jgi:hypothetical protein
MRFPASSKIVADMFEYSRWRKRLPGGGLPQSRLPDEKNRAKNLSEKKAVES